MGRGATHIRNQGMYDTAVHTGRIRRGKVVCHSDTGPFQLIHAIHLFAAKVFYNATDNITHINSAFTQIVIFDIGYHFDVAPGHITENRFDVPVFYTQITDNLFDKITIIHNEQMCVENTGVLFPESRSDFALNSGDLMSRFNERFFEAGDFGGHILVINYTLGNRTSFAHENHSLPDSYTRRHPDSLQNKFASGILGRA